MSNYPLSLARYVLAVACPRCDATAGSGCVTRTGNTAPLHRKRWVVAGERAMIAVTR